MLANAPRVLSKGANLTNYQLERIIMLVRTSVPRGPGSNILHFHTQKYLFFYSYIFCFAPSNRDIDIKSIFHFLLYCTKKKSPRAVLSGWCSASLWRSGLEWQGLWNPGNNMPGLMGSGYPAPVDRVKKDSLVVPDISFFLKRS